MAEVPTDLSVIYLTANYIPEKFALNVRHQLLKATDAPIYSVSKQHIMFGRNIVVATPRSHLNIYRQALIGAKIATTPYIAIAEDDVLYSPEHFTHRPSKGKFAYNMGFWNVFTWGEPLYSFKGGDVTHKSGRINLCNLICERELFIEAMDERFAKWDESNVDIGVWAEPGRYEQFLGVTIRETETFYTNPPNIVFTHQTALQYEGMGKRKRVGDMRATDIPYWGHINKIREMYA